MHRLERLLSDIRIMLNRQMTGTVHQTSRFAFQDPAASAGVSARPARLHVATRYMEDIRPRCCDTQYDRRTSTAQHTLSCTCSQGMVRRNDHGHALLLMLWHLFRQQQLLHKSAEYHRTWLYTRTVSDDPTRLPLPYTDGYPAKAVVVVGDRVGGFRSGRWCIETA